jgi:hypothetical protein
MNTYIGYYDKKAYVVGKTNSACYQEVCPVSTEMAESLRISGVKEMMLDSPPIVGGVVHWHKPNPILGG